MTVHQYAIEIKLTTTTANLPDYGIYYDAGDGYSTMRLITGRPDYDGTQLGVTFEDTTSNTKIWKEGLITKNGLSKPNRRVNLSGTGDYGSLSGFNFSINNTMVAGSTDPIWQVYQDNDVYLTGQTVRLYSVMISLGPPSDTAIFYSIWEGVVYNNPYDETDFKFVCKDKFYNVHKNIPPVIISKSNYPDANEDSIGDAVPVVLGDVKYSALKNVDGNVEWVSIGGYDGYAFNITGQGRQNNYQYLQLGPPNPSELTTLCADNGLRDYYIFCVSGTNNDSDFGIRILSSFELGGVGTLVLATPFPETIDSSNYHNSSGATSDTAFFKIAKLQVEFKPSEKEIKEYVKDEISYLNYTYNSTQKKYDRLTQQPAYVSLTAPNIGMRTNTISKNGNFNLFEKIPISGATVESYTTGQMYGKTGSDSNLTDGDRTTSVQFTILNNNAQSEFAFDIRIPITNEFDISEYTNIYLGFDTNFNGYTASLNYRATKFLTDQYGVDFQDNQVSQYPYDDYYGGGIYGDINFISNEVYFVGDDNGEASQFDREFDYGDGYVSGRAFVKVNSTLKGFLDAGGAVKSLNLRVQVRHFLAIPSEITYSIKEVSLFGEKSVGILSDTIYSTVSGELYDTGVETNSVYNAYRHILENYDGLTPSASIYADDIIYDDIDTTRNDWHLGRTLYKSENTFKYLKQLAEQSFTCIVPTRYGKRKIKAWLDDTTVDYAFSDTPTGAEIGIIRDSINKYEKENADQIFNEFQIDYNWSEGAKKYTRSYSVKNVEQSAFPAAGSDYSEYVSGDITYADAKKIWEDCNAVYQRYGMIRQHNAELSYYIDTQEFDENAVSGFGTDSSAYKYLKNSINWISRQKTIAEWSIPLNANTVLIELADYVSFEDVIYTNGGIQYGYVQKIEYDLQNGKINLGCILGPIDDLATVVGGDIIESGSRADTITESGSQTDTITEDGA